VHPVLCFRHVRGSGVDGHGLAHYARVADYGVQEKNLLQRSPEFPLLNDDGVGRGRVARELPVREVHTNDLNDFLVSDLR
jgi:hypothetical protein